MKNHPDLVKIAALPIENGRLLIVKWKGKPVWFSLGGLIEKNETEKDCLRREIKEELNAEILDEPILFCQTPLEKAAGRKNTTIIIKFYLVKLPKNLQVDDDEIEDYKWIDKKDYESLLSDKSIEIGSGLIKYAIPKLLELGLLK